MCGFAGFLSFGFPAESTRERRRTLVAMGDAIAHRGPDDAQYYVDEVFTLVFRRLAIIDVAGGSQPIFNETGDILIAANAEIYNHKPLRTQLQTRHTFSSHSDCEVPLHAVEEWGESAFERLNGMFAIAVWDRRTRRLLLARDRLGIKPLYVCRLSSGLLFGSELKALLAHPQCPREVDWSAVDRLYISQPPSTSYVRGVELLPGGELIVAGHEGGVRQRTYWKLTDHIGQATFGDDAARYVDEYAALLEQVTVEHLQRDVGAGIHLSGGVDSSLLAAIVARAETDLPCFTVVERTSLLGGDVDAARRLTERLSLPWLPVRFDYRTVVDDLRLDLSSLEESVWMMDSPRLEIEWLFKQELHRVAKRSHPGFKVMLLGQGADEFAGGYSTRLDAPRQDWGQYLREEVQPNIMFDQTLAGHGPQGVWQLLSPGQAAKSQVAPYHQMMLLLLRQLQHHNLWHEDRTSSWHSLEARVPFLDHRLVELLASVPAALHQDLFWNKRIVREALHRFLPGHVLRQPKIGFLDARDATSQDVIIHNLLERTATDFRDKYVAQADALFDTQKIDDLIRRALDRGPHAKAARQQLIQCMAVSIFERQCRTSQHATDRERSHRPVLPLIGAEDWPAFEVAMQREPKCARNCHPDQVVALRKGVEILTPLRQVDGRRYCFLIDGTMAGEIVVPDSTSWVDVFLRNLGGNLTRDFTAQDWIDEFDIVLDEFAEVLDLLFHHGVVASAAAHAVDARLALAPADLRSRSGSREALTGTR